MALITDGNITNAWSAGTAVTNQEFWQCRSGHIAITTAASPGENDGWVLGPGQGKTISGGKTVKFRRLNPEETSIYHAED